MLVRVIRFGKALTFMTFVAFVIISIAALIEHISYISNIGLIWGIIAGLAAAFLFYPFIVKYYTSKVFLGLYKESLVIQDQKRGLMVINWEAVKAYEIQPFESLSGSGFTLKIHQKNKVIIRISFIGISLSDNYNINDSNSLIFNLTQQINEYNHSHEMPTKHIRLIQAGSKWKYLGLFLFFMTWLISFGVFFKIKNQPVPGGYWVYIAMIIIIGYDFYKQNRFETSICAKIIQLHVIGTSHKSEESDKRASSNDI